MKYKQKIIILSENILICKMKNKEEFTKFSVVNKAKER